MVSESILFYHPRRGGRAPVPSTLNASALRAIIDAIQEAWKLIPTYDYQRSDPFHADHWHDEDELSVKLLEILNDRLDGSDSGLFSKRFFQTVIRDGKQSTAENDSYDQMPDLTFRMMQAAPGEDRDESALFVEAKLLDKTVGCAEYVRNGLHRFVSGRYAPRVTLGMMLGYAVPAYIQVEVHLPAYFLNATSDEAKLCNAALTASTIHAQCFESDHKRAAPCPEPFKAIHLWVSRNF